MVVCLSHLLSLREQLPAWSGFDSHAGRIMHVEINGSQALILIYGTSKRVRQRFLALWVRC